MLMITAEEVDRCLTHAGLVETLRAAFRDGAVQPVRHHHTVERPDGAASTLLLMPAWTDFERAGTSGGGSGLGLAIVDAIAKGSQGELQLRSPIPGRTGGFVAEFHLPN